MLAQRKLLSWEGQPERLTFKAAIEIAVTLAVTLETIATGVKVLRRENVYYQHHPQQQVQKCHCCGRDCHCPIESWFCGATCPNCGRKGHLQVMCQSKKSNNRTPNEQKWKVAPKAPVRKVDESEDESSATEDEDVPGCFSLKVNSVNPFTHGNAIMHCQVASDNWW